MRRLASPMKFPLHFLGEPANICPRKFILASPVGDPPFDVRRIRLHRRSLCSTVPDGPFRASFVGRSANPSAQCALSSPPRPLLTSTVPSPECLGRREVPKCRDCPNSVPWCRAESHRLAHHCWRVAIPSSSRRRPRSRPCGSYHSPGACAFPPRPPEPSATVGIPAASGMLASVDARSNRDVIPR